jgi:hypothetical protein
MDDYSNALRIKEHIELHVYGPQGSETQPAANAWETAKLIASLQARVEALEAALKGQINSDHPREEN